MCSHDLNTLEYMPVLLGLYKTPKDHRYIPGGYRAVHARGEVWKMLSVSYDHLLVTPNYYMLQFQLYMLKFIC